jgi:uncharacterized protein YciI
MKLHALTALALLLTTGASAQTPPAPTAPKLFAVRITTGPAWDKDKPPAQQAHFKEHSANLNRMRQEGWIVLGGRFAELGLVIVRAADVAAVQAQFAQDPAVGAGTFQTQIDEYRPFMHGSTQAPATSPEIDVVRKQLEAFNRHSPDDVVACYAENIKWLSIDGDQVATEGDGRESIRTWLAGYFKSVPTVKSELIEINQTGPHVVFRERASWTARDGTPRSQTAIGVFEVRDGLVQRAWYYPAAKPAPAPSK